MGMIWMMNVKMYLKYKENKMRVFIELEFYGMEYEDITKEIVKKELELLIKNNQLTYDVEVEDYNG
jgi:hypothetical protein